MTLKNTSLSPESVGGGVRGAMPLEYLEEDYEAGVDALPQQLRCCVCKMIIILKYMLAGLCFRTCGSLATLNSRSSWSWSSRSSTCLSLPTSTFSRSLSEVNRSVTTVPYSIHFMSGWYCYNSQDLFACLCDWNKMQVGDPDENIFIVQSGQLNV